MSWSELLLIAVVALIVIGPKDLPKVLKTLAQYARKARSLAREFQSGIEEMAREAELHEVRKEIEGTASSDYARELEQSIDPGGSIAKAFEAPPDQPVSSETGAIAEPATAPATAGEGAGATVAPVSTEAVSTPAVSAPPVSAPMVAAESGSAAERPAEQPAPAEAAPAKS